MANEGLGWSDLLGLGFVAAGTLAAGIALGWLIDDALGTSPIFILIGVALGVVAIVAYGIAKFHSALTIPNTARPNHDPDTPTKD